MMKPFYISVEEEIIGDLNARLAATRWPEEVENSKWEYGTNKTYLKELMLYWANEFDWNKQLTYLNSFSHFTTEIDDFQLHFIHHQSESKSAIPLLLIHGWPDSFVRFLKLIPLLTKINENGLSFHVVVPSIPGHGFSQIPGKPGMNNKKIAKLFADLMTDELGYENFIVHGGDAGSEIAEAIGLYHSSHLRGIHLTDIPYHHIVTRALKPEELAKEELEYLQKVQQWQQTQGAYNSIQSTKPQTLSYGLNDSPAGLAAWIIEKFFAWSDNNGEIENCFTKDELLTNISIYWITQTINSSFRRYNEVMKDMMQQMFNPLKKIDPFDKTDDKIEIPTAVAEFTTDLLPPKSFADKFFNIVQWNKMRKGGHFAAMEQPEILAEDIRKFADLTQRISD